MKIFNGTYSLFTAGKTLKSPLGKNFAVALSILPIFVLLSAPAFCQSEENVEYKIKAAYILNFLRFMEWPDSVFAEATSPLIVGVLGTDPFGAILDKTVESEKINGHPIVIERFSSWDDLGQCHALFISTSEKKSVNKIIRAVGELPVLTISDSEHFSEQGGGITFYIDDQKVRFEINIEALRKADIKASSKLLRLAKIFNPDE